MSQIKKWNIYSIGSGIVLSFMLLVSISVLFVSMVSYNFTVNDAETISTNYTVQLLREVNASIDSYISNMKSMTQVVVGNRDVRSLMSLYIQTHDKTRSYLEDQALEELTASVVQHLGVVSKTRNDITNIAVISKYKDVVLGDPAKSINPAAEFNLTDWYLKPLSYKDEIVISPSHVQNLVSGEYKWVISFSKAITDLETGDVTGVLVIDLNFGSIEAICENAQLGKGGYIYLMDNKKNLIYHQQQQLVYAGIKTEPVDAILQMSQPFLRDEASQKLYTKQYSQQTGWSAVGVVNIRELNRNRSTVVRFYVTLAALSIGLATMLAFVISATITMPIKRLENTMHKVEQGDFTVRSHIPLNNEIGHLSTTFNAMIEKTKSLMDEAVAAEEEKRKTEIRALQAQINPHFLYNTLDTIIWMAASGQNDEVVEVTSALAGLFRTSISKGETLAPLSNEIENIKSYLTIQKMRYKDRLTYAVEIPPTLLQYYTPKLVLQPIVENAVYHGVKMSQTGGHIQIGALVRDNMLVLVVEDNGVGMTEAQIQELFTPKNGAEGGIGVKNVHNRVRLSFGDMYGLQYISTIGKGTRVEIHLPLLTSGEAFLQDMQNGGGKLA